jgi:hypothetical protein
VYLVAKGGTMTTANQGANDAVALMVLLANPLPRTVTVNELATVASAFAAAQFITGEAISGNPLGLRIAAGNVPGLVDPASGHWGKVLLDPINSTQTSALASLNTLGSVITTFTTVANEDWRSAFARPQPLPVERRRRMSSKRWPALRESRGLNRTNSTRCLMNPIRSQRTALDGRHPSYRILPMSRTTSLCRFVLPAAGFTLQVG